MNANVAVAPAETLWLAVPAYMSGTPGVRYCRGRCGERGAQGEGSSQHHTRQGAALAG
ncbi:hypothetical protein ABIA32_006408, partial [Streptacidiphilus sp. MAP12-20]